MYPQKTTCRCTSGCKDKIRSGTLGKTPRIHFKAAMAPLLLSLSALITGCSVLVAPPRVAHVEVQSLNEQVQSYVIVVDKQPHEDLGIKITDNYTIMLDFQWLWDRQKEPEDTNDQYLYYDTAPLPAPWLRCIYRF